MKAALQIGAVLLCWIVASTIDFQVQCAAELERRPLIEVRCDAGNLIPWQSCACVYPSEAPPAWSMAYRLRRPE